MAKKIKYSYASLVWGNWFSSLFSSFIWWNIMIRVFIFINHISDSDTKLHKLYKDPITLFEDPINTTITITGFVLLLWFFKTLFTISIRKYLNMLLNILLEFAAYCVTFFVVFLTIYLYNEGFDTLLDTKEIKQFSFVYFNDTTILYYFIIGLFTSITYDIASAIRNAIGGKTFWILFFGLYRRPKQQKRIFIFIDLTSSTSIAEKLGHRKYSHFIQSCFQGMGHAISNNNGQVYQFVGDEVVISWKATRRNHVRAAAFFFDFKSIIAAKEKRFKRKYGIVPQFTAALHSGKVMVSEVGDVKRELAYHGDVLNTAARLQKQCNAAQMPLLATQDFINKLPEKGKHLFDIKKIGSATFTGKSQRTTYYTISLHEEKQEKKGKQNTTSK